MERPSPHREGDERNHHAHILVTTRALEGKGLGAKTTIELSDQERGRRGLGPGRAEVLEIRRDHEVFTLIYLDNRHRLIACEELFRGTIDGASVHPREVVKEPLRHNAAKS